MRIPASIQIGGHTIKIEYQSGLVAYQEAYGVFDPTQLRILIDKDLSSSVKLETFWHEVVEALNFFAEAEMDHSKIQIFGVLLHQVSQSLEGGPNVNRKKERGG